MVSTESGKTFVPIEMDAEKIEIKKGDDLAKLLDIKMIYFDLNKSDIRPDAEIELIKILGVMNEYPNMIIDVRSHTDCRQSAKYNLALSDKSKSMVAWLDSLKVFLEIEFQEEVTVNHNY